MDNMYQKLRVASYWVILDGCLKGKCVDGEKEIGIWYL